MIRVENIHLSNPDFKDSKPEICKGINIVVGSNNSGKTTLLIELYNTLTSRISGHPGNNWYIDMTLRGLESRDDINRIFPSLKDHSKFCNFSSISGDIFLPSENKTSWNDEIFNFLKSPQEGGYEFSIELISEKKPQNISNLFQFLTNVFVKFEPCDYRLNANFQTNLNRVDQPTENDFILYLYRNKTVFNKIQAHIYDTFGVSILFDNIIQGYKPIRIAKQKINTTIQDSNKLSKEWENKTTLLNTAGHGIRAYINLIFSIIDDTNQIVFIDEPELFIHPPQRRGLGKFIAELSKKTNKQLFISTHDSEFMRGVLSASEDITIFKLTNTNHKYRSHTIKSSEIKSLLETKHSNLLNERFLNSIFYQKTILCENENDRIFYEESMAKYHWKKFHSVNFIGLTGHHEVIKSFNKLIDLNIVPIAILDIDYLRTGVIPQILKDTEVQIEFNDIQNTLNSLFLKNSHEYRNLKANGLQLFRTKKYKSYYQKINALINSLSRHQIFIVPCGELESWTKAKEKNNLNEMLQTVRQKKRIRPLSEFLKKVIDT